MHTEEPRRLTIRQWAEDDRPREKMLGKGAQSLSDAELLAILIGSGSARETAVELSRRILRECGDNLNELAKLSVTELCKRFNGIGQAKAVTIKAALELGKRRKAAEVVERKALRSSLDLFDLFEPQLGDLPHEEFWIAHLNAGLKLIDLRRLTQGGIRQTVAEVPMTLRSALERSACAIAVAHNHPSGLLRPSREDEDITRRLKAGCDAIGIRLIDHLIIASGTYYSFADEGKI